MKREIIVKCIKEAIVQSLNDGSFWDAYPIVSSKELSEREKKEVYKFLLDKKVEIEYIVNKVNGFVKELAERYVKGDEDEVKRY